jgi:tetratricopeptide (TPR) repeat protein
MALSPWLTLRQAKEALRTGRPDEAQHLLEPLVAEGYRKAVNLLRDVARAYVARGERHLRAENAEAAWADLLAAESLNTGEPGAIGLRKTLSKLGLAVCRAALEAGHPLHVIETAARLADRSVRNPELDRLVAVAQEWVLASEQSDRGDFLLARDTHARALQRIDPILTPGLKQFASELEQRSERYRTAVGHLEGAVEERRWQEAVRWADAAIAAAPASREVRSLRARAWSALQPEPTTAPYPLLDAEAAVPLAAMAAGTAAAVAPTRTLAPPLPVAKPSTRAPVSTGDGNPPLPKRFLLWIDGVGGYLVCLNPRVTFGQAAAEGPVDVPLLADLSRLHAELSRDTEGYVLESSRDVLVNGLPAPRAVLKPGDRLTLGSTCQFVFHQPVPISPSARLELVSGHRLPLAVDGVVLMAEALILGPGVQVHVPLLENVPGNVVLYRTRTGLGVRFPGAFRVDNQPCQDRCDLPLPCVVTSECFTFALEPVGPRL